MRRSVRKFLASVVVVSVVFFAAAALAEDAPAPRSVIKIPQSAFDFGTVSQGTVVNHDFVIQNTGTGDLIIQRVVPACGCTIAGGGNQTIPPGKEGKIPVQFDTTGFSGEKLKTIRIYSNDMDDPSSILSLKGTVEPDVIVEPSRVFFGDVVRGAKDLSMQVKVSVRPGATSKITSVKGYSKALAVQESGSSESVRTIKVTLDPETPVGELRERIVVGISGSRETSINIPVFASVKGTVRMNPTTLSFGVVEGKEPIERSVKVENLGTTPINIVDIKSNDPAVKATSKVIKRGSVYVVHVTVDPAKVSKDLRAVVDVTTDSKDEPVMSLNVYGILPPRV